ncbi:MAG: hypothetical protein IKZ34_00230 [Alphaproteobacteria bacterium]|nr:hypothetical protein [Alphaproteobacteria bacterium]
MAYDKDLDINNKKDVIVLMDADFSFLLGKTVLSKGITQQQALELLHILDAHQTTPKSCAKHISATYKLSVQHWNKHNTKSKLNELSLSLEIGKCMKCNKKTVGMTQREKDTKCAENIKSGKCCDKMVCDTIGAVLFPDLYQKQK